MEIINGVWSNAPIPKGKPEDIICIGNNAGTEVNAYHSFGKPVIEVRCRGRIALELAQAEALIELLGEAMEFWREEAIT